MTKKEIKSLVKQLENVTGIECLNVKQLRHNSPIKIWQDAWQRDKAWFRGSR